MIYSLIKHIRLLKLIIVIVICAVILQMQFRKSAANVLQAYPRSTQIHDRNGSLLRMVPGKEGMDCCPVGIEQCSPWLVKALIAAEDKRFYQHEGVDVWAILRAIFVNIWHGKIKSGASTITTQVVKMSNPAPRTLGTKLHEAWGAWLVEKQWEKTEILERYMNHVALGGIRVGVESAALYYFGKHAGDVSLAEASVLMGLPKAPSRLRPDRHVVRSHARRHYVLNQMLKNDMISDELYAQTLSSPVVVHRRPSVFHAPHFCDYVLKQTDSTGSLRTTLDLDIQQIAESVFGLYQQQLLRDGICGAAMVVIDVKTGSVRAMIGSSDFFDEMHDGQYNCATAFRSPGSTLKPFAYAMAFDRGICMPGSMIRDEPMAYKQFSPRNYDQYFNGPLTIRQALVQSLNIPAVSVVEQVGMRSFLQRLKSLGMSSLSRDASHYGLGLVLGGCEVSLIELCNAYACLARAGMYFPSRVLEDNESPPSTPLFSATAAYLVADILKDSSRWEHVATSGCRVPMPMMALKTGTSAGNRDAWAVAFNPEYVVGVWLGNPDGQRSDQLVGATAAAPLVRDLFRQLYPSGEAPWFSRPKDIVHQMYCAKSGKPAGWACSASYMDIGLTNPEVCMDCTQKTDKQGVHEQLRILSPANGSEFKWMPGMTGTDQQVQLAAWTSGTNKIYWFINDAFYRESSPNIPVFWPLERGKWRMVCSSAGESSSVEFMVE